jgi:hypothetical protein
MIHQIALYKSIPTTRSEINGFIDETRSRLFYLNKHDNQLRAKYGNRLSRAEKALDALSDLYRCLNE